jgi:hypothetical protein
LRHTFSRILPAQLRHANRQLNCSADVSLWGYLA